MGDAVGFDLAISVGDAVRFDFSGKVNNSSINFHDEGGAILFHWNPRFFSTHYVVRNARINGSWGAEERRGGWPYPQVGTTSYWTTGSETILTRSETGWKVTIGGKRREEFDFRQRTQTAVSKVLLSRDWRELFSSGQVSCLTFLFKEQLPQLRCCMPQKG